MRFLANSRPAEGITREELVKFLADHAVESSTWNLIRNRVVTEYAFKVGARPGVVLFLEVDSEEAAAEVVKAFPIVAQGLLEFDIDPLSSVAHF